MQEEEEEEGRRRRRRRGPTLERIVEGRTQLDVPAQSLIKREPDTYPIFFNPAARVNRDVSVALVKVLGGHNFCDVMAGLGARGIRVANESSDRIEVTLNDFNLAATDLARTNARMNGLLDRTEFCEKEANVFFFSRSRKDAFDYIDIDPFGTPAPFVQGGFSASREGTIISATATDTPVLCGVHPRVSLRRYGSISRRNEFKHETGIRILLRYLAVVAAVQDVGIEPLIVHSTRHYLRVFVRARHGTARADESLDKNGYVSSCRGCGRREIGEVIPSRGCPSCGLAAAVLTAGPVWTGPLTDQNVVADAARACSGMGFVHAERLLLSLIGVDDFPPYGFDLEGVCSRLRIPSVSREGVMEALERSGHKSMKQPLESSGIKTGAEYGEVVEAVRSVAGGETGRPLPGTIGRSSSGGGGNY